MSGRSLAFGFRHFPQAMRLWRRHRAQGLLSALGIVAGITGLILVIGLGEGAREELRTALGNLGTGTVIIKPKASGDGGTVLTSGHARRIGELLAPHLDTLAPIKTVTATVISNEQSTDQIKVIGTTRHYRYLYRLNLHSGRFLADFDTKNRERVCVVGWTLGKALFPRGQVVGNQLKIDDQWYRVVGWLKPATSGLEAMPVASLSESDGNLYVPVSTFGDSGGDIPLDELMVRFISDSHLAGALDAVERIISLGATGAAPDYIVPIDVIRQKQRVQRVFQYILLAVAALMLVVGGIGIMNVMMVNVLSRRPEIGLRRAIGATRRDILAQFVTESLVIALAGGAMGVITGFILTLIIDYATPWPMSFSVYSALPGLLIAVVIGTVFGSYPALQAASVSPARSLNQTG